MQTIRTHKLPKSKSKYIQIIKRPLCKGGARMLFLKQRAILTAPYKENMIKLSKMCLSQILSKTV